MIPYVNHLRQAEPGHQLSGRMMRVISTAIPSDNKRVIRKATPSACIACCLPDNIITESELNALRSPPSRNGISCQQSPATCISPPLSFESLDFIPSGNHANLSSFPSWRFLPEVMGKGMSVSWLSTQTERSRSCRQANWTRRSRVARFDAWLGDVVMRNPKYLLVATLRTNAPPTAPSQPKIPENLSHDGVFTEIE